MPEVWDYNESVARVKVLIYRWRNLTMELATELWVARGKLSLPGRRVDLETKVSRLPTWGEYCREACGIHYVVVNRWLARMFGPVRLSVPRLPLSEGDLTS